VNPDRQWLKSRAGVSATETPRDVSFCPWAIHDSDLFVVPDATQDKRFAENPLVVLDPKIRFCAGAPLTSDGNAIGTLCLTYGAPRQLTDDPLQALRVLSRQVQAQMSSAIT
jgi:GAF domain-containing protein